VIRYSRQIGRISLQGNVLITDDPSIGAEDFEYVLHFKPPFGPYPKELSETYPLNAEVPEQPDEEALKQAMKNTRLLIDANPQATFSFRLRCLPEFMGA
jgi:7-cyano-7-deazaguanine tRNA-ribosyltransferase